ncbi:conserved hypothetical protein [Desulfofarcimen acetoxidans DSM 771]|uniref:PPC domain-containing protein n=1 Tax=Desulfofarcimen acetoxidans (strain ATCC 49208 / DSM 771 / KCTC 5769 / VKM B-1644 / 5575) TaxID=485916 RepID=C8W3N1_DESAS|nr:PPC domain-containing DNA-binding protein [Desulfofarcimen acetoxidans]ACV63817.1 conserved hypothetical protein [Desulfofarcimen acetoxidans DSM 771]
MKYQKGNIGRVFAVKMEHGDDLLEELKKLAVRENIESAGMYMIGALKSAALVTGPRALTVPPEVEWVSFADGREIVGLGTIFHDGNEPVVHLHSVFGKGESALAGCVRKDTEVYLVVEIIIMEFTGINAMRGIDPALGMKVMMLG